MNTLKIAAGFAILCAVLAEIILDFLGIGNMWRIVILSVGGVIGIALIIWGLIGLSKKDISEENVGMIYGDKPHRSIEPNTFRRVINWLRKN